MKKYLVKVSNRRVTDLRINAYRDQKIHWEETIHLGNNVKLSQQHVVEKFEELLYAPIDIERLVNNDLYYSYTQYENIAMNKCEKEYAVYKVEFTIHVVQVIPIMTSSIKEASGIRCERCTDFFNTHDELVFMAGDIIVPGTEQYPDWDKALCTECASKEGLI
jgi:hypothetical protein